ncbi:PLDc_N domain-containing protein [Vagococcus sp. DIV0080]|uniref:PLDc_N domain-containing protein n=1 Tax=Candidatus Vagococcus giribetii TaxID=2230876 RepID=A0ABS3HR50_9ENTE|nr:PLD nuclease N-terminal domain-containing protein [Vagococcus sp. DIV0080]MBO0476212.1 PLDc_N domain-containing protein [Vagococcus sp. DIV0080]
MNTMTMAQFKEILPILLPIILIQLGLMVYALLKVVKQQQFKYLNKPMWVLIVMFLQLFGPIAYLILERGDHE